MDDAMDQDWPRDYIGYGANPPDPQWPGGARIAVNFNLNYEFGGEANILDGDDASEGMLNDIGFPPVPGKRSPLAESAFEYGSRVGVWRVLRIFEEFDVKMSVLGVATASLWSEDEVGWMTGRPGPNTRRLLVEHGGFHYDRDALNDELPYWVTIAGLPHLVIPYSYETNDNRCDQSNGFAQADDFFQYMRDAFNLLYEEGEDRPALLSIGLHDRLIGRPARAVGLIKLLDHMQSMGDVWFCTGAEIAAHWRKTHPYPA